MALTASRKPLADRIWFRLLALASLFAPCVTATPYPAEETSALIASVLAQPLAAASPALLLPAKLALIACAAAPWAAKRDVGRWVIGYYAAILIVVGILQNISSATPYGWAWIAGNTAAQFLVAAVCLRDARAGRTRIERAGLERSRLWLIAPIALAFLMPYGADAAGALVPAFDARMLANEAGVTYCMITPVVIGTLLLFPRNVAPETLSFASLVGLAFGIMNLVIWFGLFPASWWMGVLHLPLVVTSALGLACARRMRAHAAAADC